MITTISSREFNQDTARAKRAANKGPVFITDRGRPSHVLLSVTEYKKMRGKEPSIVDLLAVPESEYVAFDPPRMGDEFPVPADFSWMLKSESHERR